MGCITNSQHHEQISGNWFIVGRQSLQGHVLKLSAVPDPYKLCSVDFSQLFPELLMDKAQMVYEAWLRNVMGLTLSPYCSCQTALLAKILMMRDRSDKNSIYHWDHVREILLFLENYRKNVPLLQKVRLDRELECEVLQYLDDLRIISFSLEMLWRINSQMVKGLCW